MSLLTYKLAKLKELGLCVRSSTQRDASLQVEVLIFVVFAWKSI